MEQKNLSGVIISPRNQFSFALHGEKKRRERKKVKRTEHLIEKKIKWNVVNCDCIIQHFTSHFPFFCVSIMRRGDLSPSQMIHTDLGMRELIR